MILAVDLGGTKTSLVYCATADLTSITWEYQAQNRDFSDFYHLLEEVVPSDLQYIILIVGIAGPINDGVVEMTNLDWTVSEFELKTRFNLNFVKLLNDLEAMAYYLPYLNPSEKVLLKEGKKNSNGVEVIIAVGTGLGKAVSVRTDDGYRVIKTEGGHTGFSPHSELEVDIHTYLLEKYEHISNEMLCSSIGFRNLGAYFLENKSSSITNDLRTALRESHDYARTIIQFDAKPSPSGARSIIQTFVILLGYYIGDQALSLMPDAIYIGGGLGIALEKYLKLVNFKEAVIRKGKMSPVVKNIPIYLVKKPNAAVLGATVYGIHHTQQTT